MDAHAPMMLAAPTAVNAGNVLPFVKNALAFLNDHIDQAELERVVLSSLGGGVTGVLWAIVANHATIFTTKAAAVSAIRQLGIINDALHTSPDAA